MYIAAWFTPFIYYKTMRPKSRQHVQWREKAAVTDKQITNIKPLNIDNPHMLSQIKNRVRRKPVKQSINTGGNRIIVNLERQQGSRY